MSEHGGAPRLGLLVIPSAPVADIVAQCVEAERLGYDVAWVADEKFYRDPFVTLTAVAQATSRIRLGTGVTEPYARHPGLIAMAMGTLDDLAPGRVIIGIGSGGPGFPAMGIVRRRPAAAVLDAVAIIRGLLKGETVEHDGQVLSMNAGRLNFRARELPIYVAGRGPRVLAAAATAADGVIAAPFASAAVLRPVAEIVRASAEARADRLLPPLVARVDVCISEDPAAARDAVRYMVALPVWSSFPNYDYLLPSGIELPQDLIDVVARRRYDEIGRAGELVPEELIDAFAVTGTEAGVRARLAEILTVADELLIHPVASPDVSAAEVTRIVAEQIKEIAS